MKTIARILLLALLVTAPSLASAETRKLTRAEFDTLRAEPAKLLVLDVRRPDELTSIGGFGVYLSIQAVDLEKSLAWIPKDRTVVTVSNHASRAVRAADLLTKNGFTVAARSARRTTSRRAEPWSRSVRRHHGRRRTRAV
jgi:rhodanese-related sulfurtransferase